ncbi:MAG: discoidin domain-containing protein, partial [Anaerolineae bacterium]
MAGSIQQCGTDLPRAMYDVEGHFYFDEILMPNLVCATAVTTTASSTQTLELVPINAVDCNPDTRWSSNWSDDEWISLEFSEPVTIDGVILKWEAAYGQTYTIDVSNNGVTWAPVYTETNGDGGDDEIHFPLTTIRYIRMVGLNRGTQWGYSLREFEVYRGGTSSLVALDLARRLAVYARVSGDTAAWETGQRILNWYKERYQLGIAAAYDPCTGEPLPGWENGEWPSIMADLAELAAEYCDLDFAQQVIDEKLRPKVITDPADPLYGSVGASA